MKRIFIATCALFGAIGISAQNPYISLQGASENAQGLTVSHPRTILVVDVEVECDRILAGPYARYAQKYLGLRAPLTDKTVWTLKDVPHIAGRYRNGAFCRRAESTRKANLQIHRSGRRISARAHRQNRHQKSRHSKRLRARPSTLSTRCVVIGWNSLRAMPAKMFSAKG